MNGTSNPQLKLANDFIQFTDKNVFLTGKAGTGKTTFLHNLKKKLPKRMIVVAPTGVAAINAGGVTIHSFFQMPFSPIIPQEDTRRHHSLIKENKQARNNLKKFNREKINIIKTLDLLVIDEISMVRADLLDGIDEVLRKFRHSEKPFGGVQLLMIGDLQQLAPVVKEDDWHILKDYYKTAFFFGSRALQKSDYISIELKHIYRQSDEVFINILNEIRENRLRPESLQILNKRYIPDFNKSVEDGYITLTTHNAQAQRLNESKLQQLKGKARSFQATIEGEFPKHTHPTDRNLSLKKGAQVMFIRNDNSLEKQFYNGKIGKVIAFEDEHIIVQCPGDDFQIFVERVVWENIKYSIDEETKEIKETIVGTFEQYPLKLAWAITIHKSQGLTFEKAVIDARAAFAHGQVYVALSRCKTLEGMVLSTPISDHCIISNTTVSEFTSEIEQNPPGNQQLEDSKKNYQISLLHDLFDFQQIETQIHFCVKLFRENENSIQGNFDQFWSISLSAKEEIVTISAKFLVQLQQLNTHQTCAEENQLLQARIKKACAYFIEKNENQILSPLNEFTWDTDNKSVRKTIQEALDKLFERITFKQACLKACQNGFIVKDYLEARAKASLLKPIRKQSVQDSYQPALSSVKHPELYTLLKTWRDAVAAESDLPESMVINQKILFAIADNPPLTKWQLKKVRGIGKQKFNAYADAIFSIISKYRMEKGITAEKTESNVK